MVSGSSQLEVASEENGASVVFVGTEVSKLFTSSEIYKQFGFISARVQF